jgi:LppP/LprE lipoprotein
MHLMLFHRGRYAGTATECAFGFTTVTASTDDSVTVE